MHKRITNVLRGIRHRVKQYIPRLEAEGIVIKWRTRIAEAYSNYVSSANVNNKGEFTLPSKRVKIITHMDLVTEMMLAAGYAGEDFKIVEPTHEGVVCSYHGMKIVCDPKQMDTKLVRVVEDK
jgi:hypothetical protein